MKTIIYTIGYTSFKIDDFIKVLKRFNINCLIDVRSVPRSSYYIDFDDYNIKKILNQNNILYRNYKDEFGARQDNTEFYTDGILDFEKFADSKQFKDGINKVQKACNMDYTICLMCAEKDPINCHRTILVSKNLRDVGFKIEHILADRSTCTQEDIDDRLLEKYSLKNEQLSLFSEDNLSKDEAINKAYKLRNQEIGFKMLGEE